MVRRAAKVRLAAWGSMLAIASLVSCSAGVGLICAADSARKKIVALETLGAALLVLGLAILGAALSARLPIIR